MELKPVVVDTKSAIGAWKRALIAAKYNESGLFATFWAKLISQISPV
jgi:hypothetical protein